MPAEDGRQSQDDRAGGRDQPSVVRIPRRGDGRTPRIDLRESVPGSTPGPAARRLRLPRLSEQKLRPVGEGEFEATEVALRPRTLLGRAWSDVRRMFIGRPLASRELPHERLSKVKGLAIFSSDNLSSSAYATEEIMLILILAGSGALSNVVPIAIAIALLAAIVVMSYRQTIRAYPNGGGAYVVAKENLGVFPSLLAGSALFVDYILTVAVSTAAGVAAITSAVPDLLDVKVYLAIGFVSLLTLGNLRGVRESGTLFAIPTYFFIVVFASMLVAGFAMLLLGQDLQASPAPRPVEEGAQALTVFLILRAFASGCAALTGVEAMANGVPYFRPPEAKNASTTLVWMAVILCSFFLGTAVLAQEMGIVPSESRTVVAQIAQTIFGSGSPFFYAVQVATALILILAANTSFSGLPAATSVMARDGVMPNQFTFRGDRLAFSNGILVVGILSSVLLVVFEANTHKLIPLYAFGVFMAFTLSQSGMIVHWLRSREPGWLRSMSVNLIGASATGAVALIVGVTKFEQGAWISMALMAVLVAIMWRIRAHYQDAGRQLGRGMSGSAVAGQFYAMSVARPKTVIVPVEEINQAALRSLAYARTMSPNATAIHVSDDPEQAEALRQQWEQAVPDIPLVIVDSPYRSFVEPILAYLEAIDRTQPNHMVTVVLPEFIPRHFWQRFLHNQLSSRLKRALMARANTVVVEVPYYLS